MKTYRGIVRVGAAGAVLEAGGVEVRLEGAREKFAPLDGLFTTVSGEQSGDTILGAAPALQPEAAEAASDGAERFEPVIAEIRARSESLSSIPGVLGARPGYRTADGELTEEPAVIIITRPGETPGAIPWESEIPYEVRTASAQEVVGGLLPLSAWEGVTPEARPAIKYTPPDPEVVSLREVTVRNVTCHVGPDSGWSTLKSFLEGTTERLSVAMYEFYADHIIETMTSLGAETDATLNMILQVSSNDEAIEETLRGSWDERLSFTKASVSGPSRLFNNSYHTKVAVRDSSAFWLSSGNWSPNSQPLIAAGSEQVLYSKGNREWHVIIEDAELAGIFEKFIEHDISQASAADEPEAAQVLPDLLIPESSLQPEAAVIQPRPFNPRTFAATGNPVRVRPLMSPDNYADEILRLIREAEQSLYLQFSYIRQPSTEKFDQIISAIGQKMRDGLDVRVLVGSNQNQEHSDILLARRGWKRSMFRRQTSKVHNKGILIDGKIAVVGSNNWSSDGTQYNRDASLVFFSRPITRYYTEVFLFDWDNLSRSIASSHEAAPVLAPESGPTPLGMVRVPWRSVFDE